jgi:hypothetical protein
MPERHIDKLKRARAVMGCAAVLAAGVTPVAVAASATDRAASGTGRAASGTRVAARDRFSGRITGATGALRGRGGGLRIDLNVPASGARQRRLVLTFRAAGCGNADHCLKLSGTLHGTLTAEPGRIPDAGSSFAVHATGRLRPLGMVTATGTVHGTGFTARGYEQLRLSVSTPNGKITVGARTGLVPGFTSP